MRIIVKMLDSEENFIESFIEPLSKQVVITLSTSFSSFNFKTSALSHDIVKFSICKCFDQAHAIF